MKKNVIIELKASESLSANFKSAMEGTFSQMSKSQVTNIQGFDLDIKFPPIQLAFYEEQEFDDDNIYDSSRSSSYTLNTKDASYLVRGQMTESEASKSVKNKNVIGIYSDPEIKPCLTCSGPAVGDDKDVEKLLDVLKLRKCKMTGEGVRVAIVDTGVNMQYLNTKGKSPNFDLVNSWKPSSSNVIPGSAPVGHGTMCAFDVCIAAPNCTILDIALLTTQRTGPNIMAGFLSDAILAYRHLLNVKNAPTRPGQNRSLVVNNSWGMFHPSWDFEVGHPGNYSNNPNHPFHKMVVTLEKAGADILFAAGNCGDDCPDSRCQNYTIRPIYGANSSPVVLSVAGADIKKERVGYSSKGPGRLTKMKPDITGYTHFKGSGVYSSDGGTSAACPVVAGVVAAIRTIRPQQSGVSISSPSAIRNLIRSTAIDRGTSGYDYHYGYGIINPSRIANKLCGKETDNTIECIKILCKKYPKLCKYLIYCYKNPLKCKLRKPIVPKELFLEISEHEEEVIDSSFMEIMEKELGIDSESRDEKCQCHK